MKIIKDINYSESGDVKLDLYLPETECFSTFVYFHGGGIENGDKREIVFGDFFAEKGIALVSVNYRLYPNAVYPEFIRDAAAAVAWTYQHIEEFGGSKSVFVGGSSAGAYLSMMLCFDKKYLAVHKIDSDDISGYIFDAGQPTTHFNVLRERGMDTRQVVVDEAAPLYYIKHNPNYAPMLFIVSDNDMVTRYEQTMLMIKTLESFENDMSKVTLKIMENSTHCSYLTTNDKNSELYKDILFRFIKK